MTIKHDNFGNTATIKSTMRLPYRDAPKAVKSYVLTLTADYDFDFVYHVSMYETIEQAEAALAKFSCGTFK